VIATAPHWQRLVVLAPVIVIGVGIFLGVGILTVRAFMQSVRESGHKRLIFAGLGVFVLAVLVLTYLGVSLPKE
jgi:hypothetical protein